MRPRCRAYTLVEMTVVISILALMAALVLPNMVALQRSRKMHDLEAALLRVPVCVPQHRGVPSDPGHHDERLVVEPADVDRAPIAVQRDPHRAFDVPGQVQVRPGLRARRYRLTAR